MLCSFSSSFAAEAEKPCTLSNLSDRTHDSIECQFYMGTATYRAQEYPKAIKHWRQVQSTDAKTIEEKNLQLEAKSTLAFLQYHGFGMLQDRLSAVREWEDAARSGDLEAKRHIASAYADPDYQRNNDVYALGWLESIFIEFPNIELVAAEDQGIYKDAMELKQTLLDRMTEKQIASAQKLANRL